jgi:hypothetical protein
MFYVVGFAIVLTDSAFRVMLIGLNNLKKRMNLLIRNHFVMSTLVDNLYAIPISKSDLYEIDYIKTILKIKANQNKRRVQSEKSYERFIDEIKQTYKISTPKVNKKL